MRAKSALANLANLDSSKKKGILFSPKYVITTNDSEQFWFV